MTALVLIGQAIPEFVEARALLDNPDATAAALLSQLRFALDTVDRLRVTVVEQDAEIVRYRDAEYRVKLLCSRGPVVFTQAVRDALAGRAS